MGVGEAATDAKAIDGAVADLRAITGQQPLVTHARKSIATFHLRAGMPIGAKVTLRGDRMGSSSIVSSASPSRASATSAASPRRASTAVATSPWASPSSSSSEIDFDKIDHTRGMDITIVTTAQTDEEARRCSRPSAPVQG